MNLVFALAIYFICWWIVFFIVLPFGVRTQDEEGEIEPGSPGSAPVAAHLLSKVVATTLIAACLFAIIYVVMVYDLITLDDIPFLPRYD
ncbi:hypothetical protein MnTg02_03483 [bacterium MnTg02]|nr:hypothetical protein MnTg02_03483 [bacterium MnTg02]